MIPAVKRAIELLEAECAILRESYTVMGTDEWADFDECHIDAHAKHDEMLAVAAELRKGAA